MTRTVLILGARGKFGRNAARAFALAGWHVRRFERGRDALRMAVEGVDVVVNAWNPPDYSTWAQDLLPMHQRVIDALRGRNATVILPGNVYVFGSQTPAPWSEASSHAARNPLAQLRIRMEDAYRASGLKVILLRAGDFLDTEPSGNWFDRIMVKSLGRGRFTYPGRPDAPHAWAYLPDMARASVALAERPERLPIFSDIPFPGYTLTGSEMAAALGRVTGQDVRLKQMAWWPLTLMSPVMPMLRGLREMRYLWDTPHSLAPRRFDELLPGFRHTPIEGALTNATAHLRSTEGKMAMA